MPGFQSFVMFLHHFVWAKLASSSTRVKPVGDDPDKRVTGREEWITQLSKP